MEMQRVKVSSEILGFSSELVQISSELVEISSEPVWFSSELVSISLELLIINAFRKWMKWAWERPFSLRNGSSGELFWFNCDLYALTLKRNLTYTPEICECWYNIYIHNYWLSVNETTCPPGRHHEQPGGIFFLEGVLFGVWLCGYE